VAKDFGAMPAYDFALRNPNRMCGVMCLGIPFLHGGSSFTTLPEGFYILRWRVYPYPEKPTVKMSRIFP
jgi:hypothetical protein